MAEERYRALDMLEANRECGVRRNQQYRVDCPKCKQPVMLHCDNCKVQVTGCLCTEVDRFGSSEAMKHLIERVGYESAVERMKAAGFYIPPNSEN